jgi:NADPH-dependent 2,4-dienoyl-CoA reductase/sulfur reductase-like enzyme/nitrite reductase/ring-hydroxylating ferredoxin subunit
MAGTEAVVATINDLQDGEMKQVSVGETKVLLVRVAGEFHAVGASCSHYGAPLARGVLQGDRVVCPWHNACFSATTGNLQEPPGLDSLARYDVRVEGEEVIVSLPQEQPTGLRTPSMARYAPDADGRTFAILGAGVAGIHAAETLRQVGYQGRIVLVDREVKLPYDRTQLSKGYLAGKASENALQLRSCEFYDEHDIELAFGKTVTSVDASEKTLIYDDGSTLNYDALLLGMGGKARRLPVPGAELENVFTLRDFEDSEAIVRAAREESKAVVIGGSFIGMETAASLAQQDVSVTIAAPESHPLEQILGEELGEMFQQVHEEHGVDFKLGTKAERFEGNGKVEAVVLDNGERLEADLVVLGVGIKPATDILKGVSRNEKDNSVVVDEYLQAADGLYAAGDIACYPDWRTGEAIRIEHWRVAAQHGRIAAHNMVGKAVKFRGIPFFWTTQFNIRLRYVGHAQQWDEIIFDGEPQEGKFLAFYVKDQQVLAVAGALRDRDIAAISELMRLEEMPTPDALRRGEIDWVGLLKK